MTKLLIRIFIKDSGNIRSASVRSKYGNLSGFTGIVCNIILFVIKLLTGLFTGSISVMSDAFNNLSDMASSVVTMLGFKLASKPADKEHPFGHGRMEYMSGFIVSSIIVVVGVLLARSSVIAILHPKDIAFSIVSLCVLAVSVLIKLWMFVFNRYIARAIDSDAVSATAQDSLNDSIATSAVLVCMLISRFTAVNLDPYVGLAVSGFIVYSGFKVAGEMLGQLLGKPPSEDFVTELKQKIMSSDMFYGMHDLIIHDYGPGRMFASVHVEVPSDVDIIKCHEEIDACEKRVEQEMDIILVIHMDPIDCSDAVTELREKISSLVAQVDPVLSIHDFRVVPGETRINLVFDVVVPYSVKTGSSVLREMIQAKVSEYDERYVCVIQFDHLFN